MDSLDHVERPFTSRGLGTRLSRDLARLVAATTLVAATASAQDPQFTPGVDLDTGNDLHLIVPPFAADVDGDGAPEMLATDLSNWYWLGNSGGTPAFVPSSIADWTAFPGGSPSFFSWFTGIAAAGDVDGDGDTDLLLGKSDTDIFDPANIDTNLRLFENTDGAGSFQDVAYLVSVPTDSASISVAAFADLDGDGDLDILYGFSPGWCSCLRWLENLDGRGTFPLSGTAIALPGMLDVRAIDVADLDGDGDLDIVLAAHDDDTVGRLENLGGGSFAPLAALSTTADGANDVATADIDGDGDLDVLAASRVDGTVRWFENTAPGFGPGQPVTTILFDAQSVTSADVDGDGDADVVAGGFSSAEWFENLDGAGSFGAANTILQATASRLQLADLDSDGDLDIVGPATIDTTFWENALASAPWTWLGDGSPGVTGRPVLRAEGSLLAGDPLALELTGAPASTLTLLTLSLASVPVDVLGGTWHATPVTAQKLFGTDPAGEWAQGLTWPAGFSGVDLWLQTIVQDLTVPAQLTLSSAVTATVP